MLQLQNWDAVEAVDLAGISAEPGYDTEEATALFRAHGDEWLADYLEEQFSPPRPDHVFITLRGDGHDLLGLACYEAARGPGDAQPTTALSFGVFFHPGSRIGPSDKRRLLHASLQSMKELGLGTANAVFSSKSFDTLSLLLAAGFEKPGASLIVIERSVG